MVLKPSFLYFRRLFINFQFKLLSTDTAFFIWRLLLNLKTLNLYLNPSVLGEINSPFYFKSVTEREYIMFKTIKNFFAKQDSKILHQELNREIAYRRAINMIMTLDVIENYLIDDILKTTGLLYRKTDEYIKFAAQSLYWEWKREGIINEYEDFNDETKTWIMAFA